MPEERPASDEPESQWQPNEEPEEAPTDRPVRWGWASLTVVLVGIFIGGFILGRGTAPDTSTGGTETGGTAGDGLPFPSGDVDRSDYWAYADMEGVVTDTFSRPNSSSLGEAETGQAWDVESGAWRISQERLAAPPGDAGAGPRLAVLDGGVVDGLTETTLMVVEPGAGLVFRYRDPDNYWSLTANPEAGAWTLSKVVDGQSEVVGEALGEPSDGTTVTVHTSADLVRILVEGVEQLRTTDEGLRDETRAGVIAPGGGAGDARWDRFYMAENQPRD